MAAKVRNAVVLSGDVHNHWTADVKTRLLAEPRLTRHVIDVFTAIPELAEARRWAPDPRFTVRPLRLRSAGQPDVLVAPGSGCRW